MRIFATAFCLILMAGGAQASSFAVIGGDNKPSGTFVTVKAPKVAVSPSFVVLQSITPDPQVASADDAKKAKAKHRRAAPMVMRAGISGDAFARNQIAAPAEPPVSNETTAANGAPTSQPTPDQPLADARIRTNIEPTPQAANMPPDGFR